MSGSDIWVYLEREGSQFEEASLEILGAARRLADKYNHKVTGVILGSDSSDFGDDAISYGADDVIFIKHDKLEEYGTEMYTKSLTDVIKERKPDSFLASSTRNGRDLAARLAARLRTGLSANVVTLDMDEKGTLYSGVPGYGSKIIARIVCVKNKPQMSTIRAGIFQKGTPNKARKGKVEILNPNLDGVENGISVISRMTSETRDITGSERVIVAGNGVGDNIDLVKHFAEILNADIGVTRPIADRGMFPRDVQVGSTGISLKSKLAIVLGSSGSEHFITGIANCDTVISIDIDKNSDIFDYSDYCIVGDASKILQELISKMEVLRK